MPRGLFILAVLAALLLGCALFWNRQPRGGAEGAPGAPRIGGSSAGALSGSELELGSAVPLGLDQDASGEPQRLAAGIVEGSNAGVFEVEVLDAAGRPVSGERVTLAFERRAHPGIGVRVAFGFTNFEGLVELPCAPTTSSGPRGDWGARSWVGVSRLPRVGELEFSGEIPPGSRHRIELPHAGELTLDVGLPPGVDPAARLTGRLWPSAAGGGRTESTRRFELPGARTTLRGVETRRSHGLSVELEEAEGRRLAFAEFEGLRIEGVHRLLVVELVPMVPALHVAARLLGPNSDPIAQRWSSIRVIRSQAAVGTARGQTDADGRVQFQLDSALGTRAPESFELSIDAGFGEQRYLSHAGSLSPDSEQDLGHLTLNDVPTESVLRGIVHYPPDSRLDLKAIRALHYLEGRDRRRRRVREVSVHPDRARFEVVLGGEPSEAQGDLLLELEFDQLKHDHRVWFELPISEIRVDAPRLLHLTGEFLLPPGVQASELEFEHDLTGAPSAVFTGSRFELSLPATGGTLFIGADPWPESGIRLDLSRFAQGGSRALSAPLDMRERLRLVEATVLPPVSGPLPSRLDMRLDEGRKTTVLIGREGQFRRLLPIQVGSIQLFHGELPSAVFASDAVPPTVRF